MNYNIPYDPLYRIMILEQEIIKLTEKTNQLEQRITKIESKKDTPQYLNSNVNHENNGLYML